MTPTPGSGGHPTSIPGLDVGHVLTAIFSFAGAYLLQFLGRWGQKDDKERNDILDRLDRIDSSIELANKAILALELAQREQNAYIDPIKEVMQETIRKRLLGDL